VARVLRQLQALKAHPLVGEVEQASRRYHHVPYSRPPLPHAPGRLAAWDSGHIDLLYQRGDGQWVVVDFKTERIATPAQRRMWLQEIAEFTTDAQRAALAVRSLLGVEPETLIVFLDDERRVSLERVAIFDV
jgi:ATP-dependent exoDNAse (exonuclease V) beta subunit